MKDLILDLEGVNLDDYRYTRHELREPASYTSELMDWFEDNPLEKGCFFPWPSTHPLRMRRGEIAIVSGENFSGKSAIMSQAMLYWLRDTQFADKKQKWLLISPEFSPKQNLARLVQQICARLPNDISGANVVAAMTWLQGRMLIYDVVGQVEIDDVCAAIRYAVAEHGITGVIIDNLTVLQLPGGFTDTNLAQQELMVKLTETARTTDSCVICIAHNRKPAAGEKVSRYMVRGSSTLIDLADVCIIIERNWKKAEALANEFLEDEERQEWLRRADTKFHVLKQRHGTAWVGEAKLFYDPFSMRWSEQRDAAFLPFEEVQDIENLLESDNTRGYQNW